MGMRPRVITDLKTHLVQFHDLVPGHVMILVLQESQPLSYVEGRPEPMLLQFLGHKGPVRLVTVIKSQDHQLVRDLPQFCLLCRGTSHEERYHRD